MINKRFRTILLLFILIIMNVGCSGKKGGKDDIQERLENENSTTDISNTSNSSVEQYILESSSSGYKVYVDVTIPQYDFSNLSVYKEDYMELNDDALTKYAKEIFGNNYTVLKPYGAYTLEELDIEKQECDELLAMNDASINIKESLSGEESMSIDVQGEVPYPVLLKYLRMNLHKGCYSEEFAIDEMPEDKIMCKVNASFGIVDYNEEKSEGLIEGIIDGDKWQLRAYTSADKSMLQLVKIVDGLEEIEYRYHEDAEITKLVYGENLCRYSLGEAEMMAESFANDMGYGNLKIIKTIQLSGTAGEEEEKLNGYIFAFAKVKDGLIIGNLNNNSFAGNIFQECEPGGGNMLYVFVGNNGIYKARLGMMTEYIEEEEENITLLDVEKIKMIGKDYLGDKIAPIIGMDINITNVELRYAPILIPKRGTYMIPVWFYYAEEYEPEPFVGINALDGSIVCSYYNIGVGEAKIVNGSYDYEDVDIE